MNNGSKHGVLERGAAADLWRNTLSQIPSVYGRLVYLSSLRNPNSGKYEHHGLELLFGETEAEKALRKTHYDSFSEWLNFRLEQQKADVDLYISALGDNKKAILDTWARLTPHRNLVPAHAREAERNLFFSDLEAIFALLRNVHGVAGLDQDA